LLVFNNHGNLWSHKILLWPYHRLKRIGSGRTTTGNYLRNGKLIPLIRAAGLKVLEIRGCGFYSPKAIKLIGFERSLRWERRFASLQLGRPVCVNQMLVTSLA
jgi:hypothetical protein